MNVTLYSTNCPKCKVLSTKLNQAGINYDVISDVDEMIKLGIKMAPMLKVDDQLMDFSEAIKYLKSITEA